MLVFQALTLVEIRLEAEQFACKRPQHGGFSLTQYQKMISADIPRDTGTVTPPLEPWEGNPAGGDGVDHPPDRVTDQPSGPASDCVPDTVLRGHRAALGTVHSRGEFSDEAGDKKGEKD